MENPDSTPIEMNLDGGRMIDCRQSRVYLKKAYPIKKSFFWQALTEKTPAIQIKFPPNKADGDEYQPDSVKESLPEIRQADQVLDKIGNGNSQYANDKM